MTQQDKAEEAVAEARADFREAEWLAGERAAKAFAKRQAKRAARRRDAAIVSRELLVMDDHGPRRRHYGYPQ